MKIAFIIHGTGGNPEGNWFPWMKNELENRGYNVLIPAFPTPENQSLESWVHTFEPYKKYVDENTIFIAHSVGPSFVLRILESLDTPVKGAYFASGFLGDIGLPEFDRLNDSFVNGDFDWEKIKKNTGSITMLHGSDDPYVPRKNAQTLAQSLGVELHIIENGGHLNSESGYIEFPELITRISQ